MTMRRLTSAPRSREPYSVGLTERRSASAPAVANLTFDHSGGKVPGVQR
jgi:hypothetical protein